MLFGYEVGASGTPHLQGMTYLHKNNKTFAAFKEWMNAPTLHVEQCFDIDAGIAYCKKDGNFFEKGTPPQSKKTQGKNERLRWDLIVQNAKQGRWDAIDPKVQVQQARNLDFIYNRELSNRQLVDTPHKMLWFYGPTGTGKSRKARQRYPNAYLKMCNKWWDGYRDEDVVLLEDFDKVHAVLVHHLKIWGDRYPFMSEVKGNSRKIRPVLIIVTSNYHPNQIWTDPADVEPILRRFDCIEFNGVQDPLVFFPQFEELPVPPPLPPITPHVSASSDTPDTQILGMSEVDNWLNDYAFSQQQSAAYAALKAQDEAEEADDEGSYHTFLEDEYMMHSISLGSQDTDYNEFAV